MFPLSPRSGERAGVRGAFYLTRHRPPFVPSAREAGVLFRMSRVGAKRRIEGGAKHRPIPIVIPAQAGIQFWRHAPQPPLTLALSPKGRGD